MHTPRPGRGPLVRLLPLAALLAYWALASHQLNLPGFYYDEALDLPPALALVRGEPVALMPHDPGLTILGRTLPLMILDYLGTVNTYLMLPVFAAVGANWWSVRVFEIAIGALIVALSIRWARMWFGPLAAGLGALLLALNPSFIFWSRMGISVTSVMAVCSLGSLIALTHWRRGAGDYWLGIAGWLLGLGLWAKFLFLWWLVALPAAYALLGWRRWRLARGELLGLTWAAWAWLGLGFALGAAPLVYFNLVTRRTIEVVLQALAAPTGHGVNNLAVLSNLRAALDQLRIFLDGSYFWYNGDLQSNPCAVRIYLICLALLSGMVWQWSAGRRRRSAAMLVLAVAITVQSAFTVSGIWATHLFILVPFPQMVVALAATAPFVNSRPGAVSTVASSQRGMPTHAWWARMALAAVGAALALGLAVGDLSTVIRYHVTLSKTGGYGRFSDAIYALAGFLDREQIVAPATLDWGLEKNVLILTDGRVRPREIFGYGPEPDEAFATRVRESLCPACVFVTVDPRYAVYSRDQAFRAAAEAAGYEVELDESGIFRERSGQPAYLLYRVRPAASP